MEGGWGGEEGEKGRDDYGERKGVGRREEKRRGERDRREEMRGVE